jgi:hypothetical protein
MGSFLTWEGTRYFFGQLSSCSVGSTTRGNTILTSHIAKMKKENNDSTIPARPWRADNHAIAALTKAIRPKMTPIGEVRISTLSKQAMIPQIIDTADAVEGADCGFEGSDGTAPNDSFSMPMKPSLSDIFSIMIS